MPEPGAEHSTSSARCFDCDWGLACDGGGTAFEQAYLHLEKCPGPVVTLHMNATKRVTFFSIDTPMSRFNE